MYTWREQKESVGIWDIRGNIYINIYVIYVMDSTCYTQEICPNDRKNLHKGMVISCWHLAAMSSCLTPCHKMKTFCNLVCLIPLFDNYVLTKSLEIISIILLSLILLVRGGVRSDHAPISIYQCSAQVWSQHIYFLI